MSEIDVSRIGLWGKLLNVQGQIQEHWFGSFLLNLIGYALIIAPAAFLINRWRKDPKVQRGMSIVASRPAVCYLKERLVKYQRRTYLAESASGQA